MPRRFKVRWGQGYPRFTPALHVERSYFVEDKGFDKHTQEMVDELEPGEEVFVGVPWAETWVKRLPDILVLKGGIDWEARDEQAREARRAKQEEVK